MKQIVFLAVLFFVGCSGSRENIDLSKSVEDNSVKKLQLQNPPSIGKSSSGQEFFLGGFSGLRYVGKSDDGRYRFVSHTDRGPNAQEIEQGKTIKRPFALPDFQPRILYFLVDPKKGQWEIERQILLKRPDRKPLSGLPQRIGQEVPTNLPGRILPFDPYGLDLEGIGIAPDGSYWMVDEYGPSLVKFSVDGKMLEIMKPGSGLPKILEQRRLNRGFEGAAIYGNRFYAILQSPLDNPVSDGAANSKKSQVVRILEVDLAKKRTLGQFAYLLDADKADRVGDLAFDGVRSLLVLEHNGKSGKKSYKRVYRANLTLATNLQLVSDRIAGPGGALEGWDTDRLKASGIQVVEKEEVVDLDRLGITEEKVEGIEIVENEWLVVLTDNDFQLSGELDASTGFAKEKAEPSALYFIPASLWKK